MNSAQLEEVGKLNTENAIKDFCRVHNVNEQTFYRLLQRGRAPPEDAYSIREFCRRNNMSEATYFRLQREGKGPDVMRLGRKKVLITAAAAERWRLAREADARATA